MTSISMFLAKLRNLNIQVWVEDNKLRVNAPKGVLTSELRESLALRKNEVIAYLQSATPATLLSEPTIQAVPHSGEIPLSFAQQRLWFLAQLEGSSATYNIPIALRLEGTLNVQALEKSLADIVKRHESLRTTFSIKKGIPIQEINLVKPPLLAIIDLTSFPEQDQKTEIQRLIDADARCPFDLHWGPLIRATLLKLQNSAHVLLLSMHHIVSDSWSLGILWKELSFLYKAYLKDETGELPSLAIQYADYSIWQRAWLRGEVYNTHLAYWKKRLSGKLPILELPVDFHRPSIRTYRGAEHKFILPKALIDSMKSLSIQEDTSLFMTLLSAFYVLLFRYSRQTDLIVGTPVANRSQHEIESLIGFFVNTLALRVNTSGNLTFKELLSRVRQTTLDALEHQDFPFEKLVEELQPERSLNYTPVFQVMFTFQSTSKDTLTLPDIEIVSIDTHSGTSKFDLTLSLQETDDSTIGMIEYNTDIFKISTIQRLAAHYQQLLTGIVANRHQKIAHLPLLTPAEVHSLLIEWNHTRASYPVDLCVQDLFEAQVKLSPDATAVIIEDQRFSLQELNTRANQLANYLITLGVMPETLVGIHMERTLDMVVSLLAVLKAGAAYLPLDPEYPEERLAFMLEDSGADVLLTQATLQHVLAAKVRSIVCLDTDWNSIATYNSSNPEKVISSQNLAYVIYTSGSTGKPKGVQIEHRAVCNFLMAMSQQPGLSSEDILLAITPISFDISGLEIFLPLISGASLVLVNRDISTDPKKLSQLIDETQATILQATPVTWRLLEGVWAERKNLKAICGGETMPRILAERLLRRVSSLWNMYGPTETTIWSTIQHVSSGEGTIPIGKPIANTQVYVLDNYLHPVAIGIPGDLYISGIGLGRGYLRRSKTTAERFIPNPFGPVPGSRMYNTGDRARFLPDGSLQFLGRSDSQIKLRGHRIEPGEIEAALVQHPAIKAALVILREDRAGDPRLVAYVTGNEQDTNLRDFLRSKLPEYMVPSSFVFLESFPLTPSGKIHRRALPKPDLNHVKRSAFELPRTATEKTLQDIWADVLKITNIGVYDNFFELGGHSLLATQVTAYIRDRFNVEVPLRCLFEDSTISALAVHIDTVRWVLENQAMTNQDGEDDREAGKL